MGQKKGCVEPLEEEKGWGGGGGGGVHMTVWVWRVLFYVSVLIGRERDIISLS